MKNKKSDEFQPNNPLHGIPLKEILDFLVSYYGWEELGNRIDINCFQSSPSKSSSLKFLRKFQWARELVEKLYLETIPDFNDKGK